MYVVRQDNQWLCQYATGGYYFSGPGLSGWRHWAATFGTQADAQKAADVYGGVVEKV